MQAVGLTSGGGLPPGVSNGVEPAGVPFAVPKPVDLLGALPAIVQQPASKTGGRQCSCSSRYDYVELRRTLRRVTAARIRYRRARPRVWYVAEERQLRISDLRAAKAALSPSCLQYLLAAVDPCP